MFSKAEQLRKTKKPKASMKNKPKITQHEKDYLQWLQSQDAKCFSCGASNGIEWHHVKRSSVDKKDHTRLIPLCGVSCHRLGKFSAHNNPKWFRETFPIEQQLEVGEKYYERFLNE